MIIRGSYQPAQPGGYSRQFVIKFQPVEFAYGRIISIFGPPDSMKPGVIKGNFYKSDVLSKRIVSLVYYMARGQ